MASAQAAIPVHEGGSPTALYISSIAHDHYTLRGILQQSGWKVRPTGSLEAAKATLREQSFAVVITEDALEVGTWKDVLDLLHGLPDPPQIIVTSADTDAYLWAEALNLGVYDVLTKPFDNCEVTRVLHSAWIRQQHAYPAKWNGPVAKVAS